MTITPETKLAIYNGALRRLGSRSIASLTENRESRRVMDGIWGSSNEVVNGALESGEWNFAIKTVEGIYSPSVAPTFGFRRAYGRPDDFRRLVSLCSDERFRNSLVNAEYVDEAGYWFTDYEVIYLRFVSDGPDYGHNGSLWTEGFKDYLECKLAFEGAERLTNSNSKRDRAQRDMGIALRTAKSHDAMNEGVKFPPPGSWSRSRYGGNRRYRE